MGSGRFLLRFPANRVRQVPAFIGSEVGPMAHPNCGAASKSRRVRKPKAQMAAWISRHERGQQS